VVSPAARRLFRLVLLAYPASFRREYGGEMEQLLIDRDRHDGRGAGRIMLGEILDAVCIAPRLRWETPMNRVVIIAVIAAVAIAALLAGAALALIPLAVVALAAWYLGGRSIRPIAPAYSSRRWVWWLLAGGVSIGIGVAIPQIDGGELSSLWWSVMAVAVVGGIVMAVIGILLAVSDRGHRLPATHTP
jgi:hypothetical protein